MFLLVKYASKKVKSQFLLQEEREKTQTGAGLSDSDSKDSNCGGGKRRKTNTSVPPSIAKTLKEHKTLKYEHHIKTDNRRKFIYNFVSGLVQTSILVTNANGVLSFKN